MNDCPQSLSQAELGNQAVVAFQTALFEIVQKTPSLVDHLDQTTARRMILDVRAKMFAEILNAVGDQGHLDLRGTRVGIVQAVLLNDLGLVFGCHSHSFSFNSFCAFSHNYSQIVNGINRGKTRTKLIKKLAKSFFYPSAKSMGAVKKSQFELNYSPEWLEPEPKITTLDFSDFLEESPKICIGKTCAVITQKTVKTAIDQKLPNWRPTHRFVGLHIGPSSPGQLNRSKFPAYLGVRDRLHTGIVLRLLHSVLVKKSEPTKKIKLFQDVTFRSYVEPNFSPNPQAASIKHFMALADLGFEF